MKTFKDYLTESKKTYQFKIGIAGELPEDIEDKLETVLEKYSLVNLSSPKRTPISERPLDFPQLQNVEVTYYEVELNYPTTVQVLQEYIGYTCGIDKAYVIVRNPYEPQEIYQHEHQQREDAPYEPILNQEDMGGESAQDFVGENRVMDLLKELEQARKERENDPSIGGPQGDSQDITMDQNTQSAIGS